MPDIVMTEIWARTWRHFGDDFDLDPRKLNSDDGLKAISVRDFDRTRLGCH
jgi:hypothetical protein